MLFDFGVGITLIIIGLLAVPFPMLISGYNILPKKKKEKVDIKGLSHLIRSWLVGMGVSLIIGSVLLELFGLQEIKGPFIGILLLGGCFLLLIKTNRYIP